MNRNTNIMPTSDAVSFGVAGAMAASGLGRNGLFAAIREGKLKAKKVGGRLIVMAEDLRAYIASQPDALDDRAARKQRKTSQV